MTPEEWAWAVPVPGPAERAVLLALVKLREKDSDRVMVRSFEVESLVRAPERTLRALLKNLRDWGLVEQQRTGGRGGLNLQLHFDVFERQPVAALPVRQPVAANSMRQRAAAQNAELDPSLPPIPPIPTRTTGELVPESAAGNNARAPAPANGVTKGKFASAPQPEKDAAWKIALSFYNAAHLRWEDMTTYQQNRELAIALDLHRTGANAEEALRFVQWCQQDRARPQCTDMRGYEMGRARFLSDQSSPPSVRPSSSRPAPAPGLTATRTRLDDE